MRRTRLVIAFDDAKVAVAAVREGGKASVVELSADGDLSERLVTAWESRLLPAKPADTTLLVVLPPPVARAKVAAGLPPTSDAALLTATVAQHLDRFFIQAQRRSRAGYAILRADGTAWIASFDEEALEAVTRAVASVGCVLEGIVPSDWILRSHEARAVSHDATAAPSLATLAERALLADMQAAPLALGIGTVAHARVAAARRWWRPSFPILVCACVAALMPLVIARAMVFRSERELAMLAPSRSGVLAQHARRALDAQVVGYVGRFLGALPSRTRLLATLAETLPDSCVVTQLTVDSLGVELALVASDVGQAVDALQASRAFASVVLIGGVTRMDDAHALERGSVHITLARPRASMP